MYIVYTHTYIWHIECIQRPYAYIFKEHNRDGKKRKNEEGRSQERCYFSSKNGYNRVVYPICSLISSHWAMGSTVLPKSGWDSVRVGSALTWWASDCGERNATWLLRLGQKQWHHVQLILLTYSAVGLCASTWEVWGCHAVRKPRPHEEATSR